MRMKKATAFGLAALMAATMIPAVPAMAKGDDSEGSVYYLNFKPEQADQWSDLAKKYTDETGVPVTVVTAASGTYESTLKSEMAKDEVPTLFQVNGPVGLASWKDYCYDLKDSDVYKNVESDDFVLKDDSGNYIIRENVVGDEADYVAKQNQSEDVRLLSKQVNERLRQAIESDTLLAGIYGDLRNGAVVSSSEEEGQDSMVSLEDDGAVSQGADESGALAPENSAGAGMGMPG